jgi:hypothetical protein
MPPSKELLEQRGYRDWESAVEPQAVSSTENGKYQYTEYNACWSVRTVGLALNFKAVLDKQTNRILRSYPSSSMKTSTQETLDMIELLSEVEALGGKINL